MGPPTLVELTQRAIIKTIDSLTDLGCADESPYAILRPILRKITNPEQLRLIESTSPHLAGADNGELWKAFIKRDIQQWQDKIIEPKNPASWSKVYRKLKREDERQRIAAEEQLKAALFKKKEEKDSNRANIVHAVIPQQNKARWGEHRATASGTQALKNARTGADRLAVLRRQTMNAAQNRSVTKATPTHELGIKRSTVDKAPPSMVQQYKKTTTIRTSPSRNVGPHPHPVDKQRPTIFAPRRGPVSHRDQVLNAAIVKERSDQRAREDRLRALTGLKAPSAPSPSSHPSDNTPATSNKAPPVTNKATATSNKAQMSPEKAQAISSVPPRPRTASPTPKVVSRKRPAYDLFMSAKKVKR